MSPANFNRSLATVLGMLSFTSSAFGQPKPEAPPQIESDQTAPKQVKLTTAEAGTSTSADSPEATDASVGSQEKRAAEKTAPGGAATAKQAKKTGAPRSEPGKRAQPEPDEPALPPPALLANFDAWIGVHNTWVSSAGFDPFAEDDALTEFSLGVGVKVMETDQFAIAIAAFGDLGGEEANLRGDRTDFTVERIAVGPELRWPLIFNSYLLGRLAPLILHTKASIEESSSEAKLSESKWSPGAELSVGLGWRFGYTKRYPGKAAASFWLRAEAGYMLTTERDMLLKPEGKGAPVRTEPMDLPNASLNGVTMRLAGGIGF